MCPLRQQNRLSLQEHSLSDVHSSRQLANSQTFSVDWRIQTQWHLRDHAPMQNAIHGIHVKASYELRYYRMIDAPAAAPLSCGYAFSTAPHLMQSGIKQK